MHRGERNTRVRTGWLVAAAVGAAAAAVLSGSCLGTGTAVCEISGLRCKAGQVCSLSQDACIDPGGCGDGLMTPDEVCDDGNTHGGDGCSADCTSNETCGNGKLDTLVGELCDDGNTASGDGCSSDCRSRESCGNGIVDVNEECDSGGQDTVDCNADCTISRCGDGHANHVAGEGCDSGGVTTSDCNGETCQPPRCGDGFYDPPREQCDTTGNTQACNADCTAAQCGDGFANPNYFVVEDPPGRGHFEQCDGGQLDGMGRATRRDTISCNSDCTTPSCGDGHFNSEYVVPETSGGGHREQCDTGANSVNCNGNDNGNGVGNCLRPRCGDGYVNPLFKPNGIDPEECDPGGGGAPPVPCNGKQTCDPGTCRCHP